MNLSIKFVSAALTLSVLTVSVSPSFEKHAFAAQPSGREDTRGGTKFYHIALSNEQASELGLTDLSGAKMKAIVKKWSSTVVYGIWAAGVAGLTVASNRFGYGRQIWPGRAEAAPLFEGNIGGNLAVAAVASLANVYNVNPESARRVIQLAEVMGIPVSFLLVNRVNLSFILAQGVNWGVQKELVYHESEENAKVIKAAEQLIATNTRATCENLAGLQAERFSSIHQVVMRKLTHQDFAQGLVYLNGRPLGVEALGGKSAGNFYLFNRTPLCRLIQDTSVSADTLIAQQAKVAQ